MREIKFRQWDGARFHEWGMIDGSFIGPSAGLGIRGVIGPFNPTTTPHQQFTGLRDVNGVEIYEGDIVSGKYSKGSIPLEVKFYADTSEIYHCGGCCGDSFDGSGFAALSDRHSNIHLSECTVIGNIYENPELLK